MSDRSKIEWTDATWNPIVGCSVVSPGCTNCYAMRIAPRTEELSLGAPWAGAGGPLTRPSKAGPVWTGALRFVERRLDQPLRWKRPRKIFVNSMSDLFHDSIPDDWIDRVFAAMALSPQHTFQVLTKRPKRMRAYLVDPNTPDRTNVAMDALAPAHWCKRELYDYCDGLPLPNVWLGVSAEDQPRLDERVPDLLATPSAVRVISCEPLLGPIVLPSDFLALGRKAQVIVGGESGPNARPMHPDWARSLRDQCAAAGVAYFFKQWGEFVPDRLFDNGRKRGLIMKPDGTRPTEADVSAMMAGAFDFAGWQHFSAVGKKAAGALLDGRAHREFPQ